MGLQAEQMEARAEELREEAKEICGYVQEDMREMAEALACAVSGLNYVYDVGDIESAIGDAEGAQGPAPVYELIARLEGAADKFREADSLEEEASEADE